MNKTLQSSEFPVDEKKEKRNLKQVPRLLIEYNFCMVCLGPLNVSEISGRIEFETLKTSGGDKIPTVAIQLNQCCLFTNIAVSLDFSVTDKFYRNYTQCVTVDRMKRTTLSIVFVAISAVNQNQHL